MRVRDIMATPVDTLSADMKVKDAVEYFAMGDRHKSYPVVDEEGHVSGMVSRADMLRWVREGFGADETLGDLKAEMVIAYPDELAGALADRMAETGASRVPVVARGSGELVGLVARRELLRVRAMALKQEREREGTLTLPG